MSVHDRNDGSLEAIKFRDFVLSFKPMALSQHGTPVELQLQPLRLLALLASRRGELVTHEQVRHHLWGDRTVSFNKSIHVYISQIRAALHDNADNPTFIENVPRQGYRFLPTVRHLSLERSSRLTWRRSKAWFGGAVLGSALVVAMVVQYFETGARPVAVGEAWDAYQRGMYLLDQQEPSATQKSVEYFEAALSADPGLAEAHLGTARALGRLGKFAEAKERALDALELNTGLVEAYVVLGLVDMLYEWEWDAALKNFREALTRDSANVAAHQGIATYYVVHGDLESGIAHMRRARQLDPASTIIRADFGWFYYFAGEYEQAATTCGDALDLAPEVSTNRHCLIRSLSMAGQHHSAIGHMVEFMKQSEATDAELTRLLDHEPAEALLAFDRWRLKRSQRDEHVDSMSLAFTAASVGDFETALATVEQALQERHPMIPFIAVDPVFEPVHDHPRFKELLGKLNLGET